MTGQGEGGAVLGEEEAYSGPGIAVGPPLDKWPWLAERAYVSGGKWKFDLTVDEVAALVAQAYERGRADGATEERDRILGLT